MENSWIPLSRPSIDESDLSAVTKVLLTGNLVQGEIVDRTEKQLADYFDSKFAILVSNGTAALHLSLLSLGIDVGDEVIVPTYSFVATANAVRLAGANPVFADTCGTHLNVCVESVKKAITSKTKAIIVVHEFGFTANMTDLIKLSFDANINLIEDAACAFGSETTYGKLGTLGDIGCFSFHPRKVITCGEGGLIITNNPQKADFIKSMRSHGLSQEKNKRTYSRSGYNYRLTDFSAALLLNQFKKLPEILSAREKIANRYLQEIRNKVVTFPETLSQKTRNWQTFPIILSDSAMADEFIDHMKENGIECIRPAQLIPLEPAYSFSISHAESEFANSLSLWRRCVAIPMYDSMSSTQIKRVIGVINEF